MLTVRHENIMMILSYYLSRANPTCRFTRNNPQFAFLFAGRNLRPNDLVCEWPNKPATLLDGTVYDPHCASPKTPEAHIEAKKREKATTYGDLCRQRKLHFEPLIFSSFGAIAPDSMKIMRMLFGVTRPGTDAKVDPVINIYSTFFIFAAHR